MSDQALKEIRRVMHASIVICSDGNIRLNEWISFTDGSRFVFLHDVDQSTFTLS